MASSKARGLTAHAVAVLGRPLTRADRERVAAHVRAMLGWQRSLSRWPNVERAPDATPFVSVYAKGTLRGCFGSHEGAPGERLARAFLRALEDSRYGCVRAEERAELSVCVSYVRETRAVDPARVAQQVEPGSDGLLVVRPAAAPVILLPSVARDRRSGAADLLAVLARKANIEDWAGAALFALRTDDVIVHARPQAASRAGKDPLALATRWLGSLVARDGQVTFAVDARRRESFGAGRMVHGRAAVVVRALELRGHPAARKARTWLARCIADALRGADVPEWPADPAMAAGTLALARLAGLEVHRELLACAGHEALRQSPWHAAQVVAALGREAPSNLWRACVDDLDARPWAPWTLVAARAVGDARAISRTARALVASVRASAPHEGGCGPSAVPEIALTALVVEALEGLPDAGARTAVRKARRFLSRSQLLPSSVPASLDPALAAGAFPASPILVDVLRCDVTAHAVLALRRS